MPSLLVEMEKLKVPHSGLGQFCLHLGEALPRLRPAGWDLAYYVPPEKRGAFGEGVRYVRRSPLHKLVGASRAPFDVWHCIHQESRYPPPRRGTRLVLTIHDLNFLVRYGRLRAARKLVRVQRLVDRAEAVTFISEFTARTVRAHLRLDGKPTRVIYDGNSLRPVPSAPRPAFAPPGPFLFGIGIVGPKKNFHVLVPFLKALGGTRSLVIAGDASSAYADEIRRLARDEGIAGRVILPGGVDDAARFWLYSNCEAFVFPSLAEGFGIPVIEAMSVGKPVFLSTHTSLPEVGGTEAYYWPELVPGPMREAFERGMAAFRADPGKPDRLRRWAARFTWEKCARSFWEVYEAVRAG